MIRTFLQLKEIEVNNVTFLPVHLSTSPFYQTFRKTMRYHHLTFLIKSKHKNLSRLMSFTVNKNRKVRICLKNNDCILAAISIDVQTNKNFQSILLCAPLRILNILFSSHGDIQLLTNHEIK